MQMSVPTQMSTTISVTPLTSPGYKREDDSPQMGSQKRRRENVDTPAKRLKFFVGREEKNEWANPFQKVIHEPLLIHSLSLISVPSLFTTKVFCERINPNVFNKLVGSKYLRTKSNSDEKFKKGKPGDDIENEHKQFQKLKKRLMGDILEVRYVQSRIGWGRVCAKKGMTLGLIRGPLRHTLCKGNYLDLDMKNCHPTILYLLCKEHGIECTMLTKYVEEREPWLKRLQQAHGVTRTDAKKLLLKLLNGGKYDSWLKGDWNKQEEKHKNPRQGPKDNDTVEYAKEIQRITNFLISRNEEMSRTIQKNKDYNKEGTFMSIYLQEFEKRLLEETYSYLVKRGIVKNDCVLCYDGIMVIADRVKDVQQLCRDLRTNLKGKTGFDIVFEEKSFDEAIDDIVEPMKFTDLPEPVLRTDTSDEYLKKFEVKGKYKHHHGNLYVATGDWSCPGQPHQCNTQFDVFEDHMYCYGCRETYYPIDPRANDKQWQIEVKNFLLDVFRGRPLLKELFQFEGQKLGKKKREKLLSELTVSILPTGKFQMANAQGKLTIGMEFSKVGKYWIKTPDKVRDKLFSHRYMSLDKALERKQLFHENTIDKPILEDGVFTCGKYAPSFDFSTHHAVVAADRDRCGYICKVATNTIASSLPMGSGKTHGLIEHLRRNDYQRILVVVGRRSFGEGIVGDLNATRTMKFKYYEDVKNQKPDRLVCQVDSLRRFALGNGKLLDWDLVIIDEVVTVLCHFQMKQFKQPRSVFGLLQTICRKVDKLVVMDADMEKTKHVDWFLNSCGRTYTKIRSDAKTDDRLYLRLSDSDDMYLRITELIRKGLKVVIMSNTATEIKAWHERLEKEFPDKNGLAIYNEVNHKYDAILIGRVRKFDKNKDTKNLNWFAFSPSISPGVSITDPFDVLCAYGMASELTAGVRYWQQMSYRCRVLRKNLVLYKIVNSQVPYLSQEIQAIKSDYECGVAFLTSQDVATDYSSGVSILSNDPFTENCVYIEQQARFNGTFENKFKKWKKKDGGTFDYLESSISKEKCLSSAVIQGQVKKQNKKDKEMEICKASVLTLSEYEKQKGNPTPEVSRYCYCKRYNIDPTVDADTLHNHRLLVNSFGGDECVQHFTSFLFDWPVKDPTEKVRRKVFKELIKICGWDGIGDKNVFSENDSMDVEEMMKLMKFVETNERISKELNLKKASDPLTFAKYALNSMGKRFGLGRIMCGNKPYRKRRLRTEKFESLLELAFMRGLNYIDYELLDLFNDRSRTYEGITITDPFVFVCGLLVDRLHDCHELSISSAVEYLSKHHLPKDMIESCIENIKRYGWDSQYGYHGIRTSLEGLELA